MSEIAKLDPRIAVIEQTATVIPFLIKTAVLCGLAYYVYSSYTNRFKKMDEVPAYGPANITKDQAKGKAESIYGSISLFGNSLAIVSQNLAGLNYNGFVRLYNAFGEHTGTLLGGELDLIGWLKNQFDDYEMQQLSMLTNGAFF